MSICAGAIPKANALPGVLDRANEIVDELYDAALSGADPVDDRPGFADMLKRIAGNGVQTIIVETANRFARDLIVQDTTLGRSCRHFAPWRLAI